MTYQTIQVRFQQSICYIQFNRPESNNSINDRMVEELHQVLVLCEESATVVVLEGSPDVFCSGGDFQEVRDKKVSGSQREDSPELLYDLLLKIAGGSYVTISHVRGRANAGGMGFVAASDIVIADQKALFSLSELLFGLFPACVLPFLIKKVGSHKANYLTLTTQPINVEKAYSWGLVDEYDVKSETIIRKHLLRLRYLSKAGIARYKSYTNSLDDTLLKSKPLAVEANNKMFSDTNVLEGIARFVENGTLPWKS